jgi:hypothetical protein
MNAEETLTPVDMRASTPEKLPAADAGPDTRLTHPLTLKRAAKTGMGDKLNGVLSYYPDWTRGIDETYFVRPQ